MAMYAAKIKSPVAHLGAAIDAAVGGLI